MRQRCEGQRTYQEWLRAGRPCPPHHFVKQEAVKEYARAFGLHVFVETGTGVGTMVDAVKDVFEEIYSIELSRELHEIAKRRFRGMKHITIIQGDSGQKLSEVLVQVKRPCLFWLDSHYSGGNTAEGELQTPIEKELSHVLGHSAAGGHVILIDDARLFTGSGDWPSIETLQGIFGSAGFDGFGVKDDVIRAYRTND